MIYFQLLVNKKFHDDIILICFLVKQETMPILNPIGEEFHFYIIPSGQMYSCSVYVYFHSLSHITLQKKKKKGDTVLR